MRRLIRKSDQSVLTLVQISPQILISTSMSFLPCKTREYSITSTSTRHRADFSNTEFADLLSTSKLREALGHAKSHPMKMHSSVDKEKKRKRASLPKAKTGCITCKLVSLFLKSTVYFIRELLVTGMHVEFAE